MVTVLGSDSYYYLSMGHNELVDSLAAAPKGHPADVAAEGRHGVQVAAPEGLRRALGALINRGSIHLKPQAC